VDTTGLCLYPLPSGPCGYGIGHESKHRSIDYLDRKRDRHKVNGNNTRSYAAKERPRINYLRDRVSAIKIARGCADCGYADPRYAGVLEFDHVDATNKEADICSLVSNRASWERIEAEIAKCDVLCANHHRIRTIDRSRGLRG
jgi:hypothetical protein